MKLELSLNDTGVDPSRPKIQSPSDAYNILKHYIANKDREHLAALHLNTIHQVVGIEIISIGTLAKTQVHPREVFKAAVLNNSYALIIAHNHPSGSPEPSTSDIELTIRLNQAADILGIPILDHLILSPNSYISMKQEGHVSFK